MRSPEAGDGASSAPPDRRYDVIVSGARCAGASAALLMARAGLRVLVVDPVPEGRDTLSTHALMRGAVLQLARWGVLDDVREARTPPIRRTAFDYGDHAVAIDIEPEPGVEALYAPRRTVLDRVLARAAAAAGAHVVRGRSVVGLVRERGRVRGVELIGRDSKVQWIEAELVVGADGLHSRVAREVAAPLECVARHATASIYGYWRLPPSSEYRWYFRQGSSIGAIPTNDGLTCVFASVPPTRFAAVRRGGLERLLLDTVRDADPELADRMAPGHVGPLRAFAGQRGFLRRASGPGWALVGDAGFFKDPLTAHGITDALRDAELLARAVCSTDPLAFRGYQEERDRVARPILEVTDAIASLAWSMDEARSLHRDLSRAMGAGVEVVRGFEPMAVGEARSA